MAFVPMFPPEHPSRSVMKTSVSERVGATITSRRS